MLVGAATTEGTYEFMVAHPDMSYQSLLHSCCYISQVGYGTYRFDRRHSDSMKLALRRGVNLIDTSAFYSVGESEDLIGEILNELVEEGSLNRNQVYIVSKAGFVQIEDGDSVPGMFQLSDQIGYSIHPEFLESQLTGILGRLRLETLDCLLLHNPEQYLLWAKLNNVKFVDALQELEKQIAVTFDYLEMEVRRGRIKCYGLSSNTLSQPKNHFTYLPLDRFHNIAKRISTNHNFHFIQFPMNLFETSAATEENLPDKQSVLEFASVHQLNVLVNRPFDAMTEMLSLRLVDIPEETELAPVIDRNVCLDELEEQEEQISMFIESLLKQLSKDERTKIKRKISFSILYRKHRKTISSSLMMWQYSFQSWFDDLSADMHWIEENYFLGLSEWNELSRNYIAKLKEFDSVISYFLRESDRIRIRELKLKLTSVHSQFHLNEKFSCQAIRALRMTEGIHSILVGMRKIRYVNEVSDECSRAVAKVDPFLLWSDIKKEIISR
ncbi:aldo/keto reductase [Paenibacillus sp. JCM 10914]|uniref:aldo/keto reductase n=1 Tax=Paenibacillus sp. JCM 10914 TaxID=1236974 RepID=UPI0003CC4C4E|nr:aldo/keto reductase [Paenibacillus sp. JCM 10914]GAE10029.1 hypothetical protein JCM10914_6428 [Paenibacillus sp. JCM 10914]